MALVRWWPKASLSWGEDYGEGVEAMGDVFEKVESVGVDGIEVCELGQGFLAGVCVEDCFCERVFGEGLAGHGERVVGAGALLGWRQLAADLQGCGREEFADTRSDLDCEEGGFRQTRGTEITQWMCSFTLAATLKWGAEIEQWMRNFSLWRL